MIFKNLPLELYRAKTCPPCIALDAVHPFSLWSCWVYASQKGISHHMSSVGQAGNTWINLILVTHPNLNVPTLKVPAPHTHTHTHPYTHFCMPTNRHTPAQVTQHTLAPTRICPNVKLMAWQHNLVCLSVWAYMCVCVWASAFMSGRVCVWGCVCVSKRAHAWVCVCVQVHRLEKAWLGNLGSELFNNLATSTSKFTSASRV